MKIAGTPDNSGLARAVNSRVSADARMLSAKATLLTLGGIGLAALCVGAGAALAILAYARLNDRSLAAAQVAEAITKGLAQAKLTVAIDPTSQVKLDPSAEVKLASGGEVTAKGTVGVAAGAPGEIPRPTPPQLNATGVPESKARVTTEYTVFKSVKLSRGRVVTGYNFTPDADLPKWQYCYFAEEVDGVEASVTLATDGVYRSPKPRPGVDLQAAASNCVWFGGGRTNF